MQTKSDLLNAALARIALMNKGDPVTNVCAGSLNPRRKAYFCALITKKRTNKYGIVQTTNLVKCTDKKANYWTTGVEVIYPGHIDYAECCKLFEPIHAVMFGKHSRPLLNMG